MTCPLPLGEIIDLKWPALCAFADSARPVAVEGMKSAIVTGGLGALGLLTAHFLADSGEPNLIIRVSA
jgi:hypothetical protein